MNENDTPETDAVAYYAGIAVDAVDANFARKMERERDALRDAIRNLRDASGWYNIEIASRALYSMIPANAKTRASANPETTPKETTL